MDGKLWGFMLVSSKRAPDEEYVVVLTRCAGTAIMVSVILITVTKWLVFGTVFGTGGLQSIKPAADLVASLGPSFEPTPCGPAGALDLVALGSREPCAPVRSLPSALHFQPLPLLDPLSPITLDLFPSS
jgi:hypothetical protein